MAIFQGVGRLIRLNFRRDRIKLPVTISLIIIMIAGSAPALASTYPDLETQASYVVSSAPSVVGRLFQGTVQGISLGTILMAEVFLFSAVIIGIINIMLINRHTRHNEETGSAELIGSGVVSKSAPLTSALLTALIVNLLMAVLVFLSLFGVTELDRTGSFFLGLSLASIGLFFAGLASVTAQLSDYRRGANGLAIGALIIFFLIRGLGDALGEITADGLSVTASWITWLSPIGWSYQVLPYSANRWLPIILLLLAFLLMVIVSYWLQARRDIGSSIFQAKAGPRRASAKLLANFGLNRRLHQTNILAWLAGFAIMGGLMAVVINDFRATFEENEVFQEFLATSGQSGNFIETIIATMFPLLSAMLAGYVVSAVAKMQDEETSGRLEYLLATSLGKVRWLGQHLGLTIFGIFAGLTFMGLAGGIGYRLATTTNEVGFADIFLAAIANIPAMLLFLAVITLIFALNNRFTKVFAWSFYGYCTLIGSFVGIFGWPDWVGDLSPFIHTPAVPISGVSLWPILSMTLLAGLVLTGAMLLFYRRDISLK